VGGSYIRELFGLGKGIYRGCADLRRVLIFVQAGSVDLGLGLKLGVRHGDCQGLTSREGGGGT
jgi:hypothetical protein